MPQLDNDIIAGLCRHYGLGAVRACRQLGGTRNRNYVLDTSSGRWFVRQRYPGYCAPARIAFDDLALTYLAEHGAAVVPPRDTLSRGKHWRDGERVWQVFPFVTGRHLREGRPDDLGVLGIDLGRLHRAGEGFSLRYEKLGLRGETDPAVLLSQAEQIQAEDPQAAAALEPYGDWVARARRELPDDAYAALPHTLVHGDVQPANVLVHRQRIAAFVDLDWCAWQPRVYDLAFALLFCCATHETPIDGDDIWSLTQPPHVEDEPARAFLDAYQQAAGPLTGEERQALAAQVALTWCHCRLAGALKAPAQDRIAFLSRGPADMASLTGESLGPFAL